MGRIRPPRGEHGPGGQGGPGGPAMRGEPSMGRPPGSRPDEGYGPPRMEPWDNQARIQETVLEAVRKLSESEDGQTNSIYYVFWKPDRTLGARSANAPTHVEHPLPESGGRLGSSKGPLAQGSFGTPPQYRDREGFREAFRVLPFNDCILVGRSLEPNHKAMRRLAYWLIMAGGGILGLGLAGGWWLATRAIRPIEEISAAALLISRGDLSQRISASDTDSELGRLASVLNSAFARLEASFAQQIRFTANASHELRTPLSVILTQTQTTLARQRDPQEYREALEACQRAAQRMRRLTESLLELARLDAGQEPMKREGADLSRITQECVEFVRPLAAQRKIQLECELAPAECLGDPERLSQVVTNLLSNAIHFNHEGGKVRISTRLEAESALLEVGDTGQGIPDEDLPHIFERFYRVDQSRSGIQGQTGLGLSICKAIVEAHQGTVSVTSQPGQGSLFRVAIPVRCPEQKH